MPIWFSNSMSLSDFNSTSVVTVILSEGEGSLHVRRDR